MNHRPIVRRRDTMPTKPGFFDYLKAAFNARPFGMFVAPNWIGLGAFAMLGALNPGFWVLGAGLELGYLLMLATNPRFQRLIAAQPLSDSTREWNTRIQKLITRLDATDRRSYDALAERCRSIIDIQLNTGVGEPHGLEAQADSLGRLSWMYLRLLVARQTLKQVLSTSAVGDLTRRLTALKRQHDDTQTGDELKRSLAGQIEILTQRLQQRADAERKLTYIDAELERIAQQVELIREQAALSSDPELLSRRIDEIAATLGTTGQWIRDQQSVYGAMEDLLTEPPPLTPDARARESQ